MFFFWTESILVGDKCKKGPVVSFEQRYTDVPDVCKLGSLHTNKLLIK